MDSILSAWLVFGAMPSDGQREALSDTAHPQARVQSDMEGGVSLGWSGSTTPDRTMQRETTP